MQYSLREKCRFPDFFLSVFSRIWTEYRYLFWKSPYSVRMPENKSQKNSEHGHFLRRACYKQIKTTEKQISTISNAPMFLILPLNYLYPLYYMTSFNNHPKWSYIRNNIITIFNVRIVKLEAVVKGFFGKQIFCEKFFSFIPKKASVNEPFLGKLLPNCH